MTGVGPAPRSCPPPWAPGCALAAPGWLAAWLAAWLPGCLSYSRMLKIHAQHLHVYCLTKHS
eukprot:13831936-Heterocapsa_arctica.AAC.1